MPFYEITMLMPHVPVCLDVITYTTQYDLIHSRGSRITIYSFPKRDQVNLPSGSKKPYLLSGIE